jgi:hypothetical protein
MCDAQRDDQGRFLPGHSIGKRRLRRRANRDRRTRLWEYARQLAEKYPREDFIDADPCCLLLLLFHRGVPPDISDFDIKHLVDLPDAKRREFEKKFMLDMKMRINCLTYVTGFMLPRLRPTKLKTEPTFETPAELLENSPKPRRAMEELKLVMQAEGFWSGDHFDDEP